MSLTIYAKVYAKFMTKFDNQNICWSKKSKKKFVAKENCRTNGITQSRIKRTWKHEKIHNSAGIDENELMNWTETNYLNSTVLQ